MERPKEFLIREDVFVQLPAWARKILELAGYGPRNITPPAWRTGLVTSSLNGACVRAGPAESGNQNRVNNPNQRTESTTQELGKHSRIRDRVD